MRVSCPAGRACVRVSVPRSRKRMRSEEHTSELQSRLHLVCRLLLEKKKDYLDLLHDLLVRGIGQEAVRLGHPVCVGARLRHYITRALDRAVVDCGNAYWSELDAGIA